MQHCVIAIAHGDGFVSVVCYGEELSRVGPQLETAYTSIYKAQRLIGLGDVNCLPSGGFVSFYRDWGYAWNDTCPVLHASDQLLRHYALSIGAQVLYLHQDGGWQRSALLHRKMPYHSVA